MPTKAELPKTISAFAYRHGVSLRPDPFFRGDVGLLINQLKAASKARAKKLAARKTRDASIGSSANQVPSVSPLKQQPLIVAEFAESPRTSPVPIARIPQQIAATEQALSDRKLPAVYSRQLAICSVFTLMLACVGIFYAISIAIEARSSTTSEITFPPKYTTFVFSTVQGCLSLASIVGAVSALRRRRHLLALLGSYAIVIPCLSPLFGIGLPLGIWFVVILQHPQVRASFK